MTSGGPSELEDERPDPSELEDERPDPSELEDERPDPRSSRTSVVEAVEEPWTSRLNPHTPRPLGAQETPDDRRARIAPPRVRRNTHGDPILENAVLTRAAKTTADLARRQARLEDEQEQLILRLSSSPAHMRRNPRVALRWSCARTRVWRRSKPLFWSTCTRPRPWRPFRYSNR